MTIFTFFSLSPSLSTNALPFRLRFSYYFLSTSNSMGCSTSDLGQRMTGTEFQSLLFYHLSLIFISLIIVYFRSGHKEIFPIFQCLPFRIIRCTNNSESWHDKAFLRNTASIQSIFSDRRFTCFLREQ